MSAVVITGAAGFVGSRMCERLAGSGEVRAATRTPGAVAAAVRTVLVPRIDDERAWDEAMRGADVVYHLAGRAHQRSGGVEAYRQVNVRGTEAMARAAVRAGVRKIVYLSSAKVNGDVTSGPPFREDDPPAMKDAYGTTKWEAEVRLRETTAGSGTAFSIVRPPMVYGPGVKANFRALMRAVWRGVPLPFAKIANRRSLVFVDNLIVALTRCAARDADGETFYVSDQHDVSTPELTRMIGEALGRPARLIAVPRLLVCLVATACGRRASFERLYGSLVVDSSKITRTLGWTPPFTMEEGLRRTAEWFREAEA